MGKKKTLKSDYLRLREWVESNCEFPKWVAESIERLYDGAAYDHLTQLFGPRAIAEEVEDREEERRKNKGESYLLFYDIDDFKTINNLGKEVGDMVLKRTGYVLNILRAGDGAIPGRYSGGADELILYLGDTNYIGALMVDAKVRKYIEKEKKRAARILSGVVKWAKRAGKEIDQERVNEITDRIENIGITGCVMPVDAQRNGEDSFKKLFGKANNALTYIKESEYEKGSTYNYEDITPNLKL